MAVNYDVGDWPISIFAVDLDADGDNDLAISNHQSNNISILRNNGDGTFQTAVDYGVGVWPNSVYAVDLDGDFDNDLTVDNGGSDDVSVLLNNGDGTFQTAINYGCRGSSSLFAVDLDGDGDSDLAVTNSELDSFSILINRSITTGAVESTETPSPKKFRISQNFPNPFNATTTIQYSLSEPSQVTLDIYDILGRKIQTLINIEQSAGYHQAIWNAGEYSSGIYLFRIEAGAFSKAKKMILLK